MSIDKFHCTNGHCLTDCVLSTIDYDRDFPPGFCPHSGIAVCWQKCETAEKKPTVFNRITASPEVIAESSVYFEKEHTLVSEGADCGVTFTGGWTSPFIEYKYGTKPEAIAATVAKLKEVAE